MQIAVVGTGYVGLVAGTCLAAIGHQVVCIDNDQQKVADLKKGIIPIYEPELEELIKENVKGNRLFFSDDFSEGIKSASVIFIAVPTPEGADGSADLSYVWDVARKIGELISEPKLIVVKSTVTVGTNYKIRLRIQAELEDRGVNLEFDVVSNPEFMREGMAVRDFLKPDRIVIGTNNALSEQTMRELYQPLINRSHPLVVMDPVSAEVTKYAANSLLATKISFINEIAKLCEAVGGDVCKVSEGIGSDRRIGKAFLAAGLGYGGSCFPKDLNALRHTMGTNGIRSQLLDAVVEINQNQLQFFLEKIKHYFHNKLRDKVIAVWGLAFKPNTDDIRESPAIELIRNLVHEGVKLKVYDPQAMNEAKYALKEGEPEISYCINPVDAIRDADSLIVTTDWNCFKKVDLAKIGLYLKEKVIFDGRNIFNPMKLKQYGFTYFGIGRMSYV